MAEPAKVPEPSAPKKSLLQPQPKLPSFNKSSTSSYTLPADWQQVALNLSYPTPLNSDSGAPLSPVQVENYCNDTLQYLVKAESPVIAAPSIPLLQYPEVDVKVIGTHTSAKPPLRVKVESPPLARKRSGSTLGDPLPRKRQKMSTTPPARASKQSPRHPSVCLSVVLRRKRIAIWRIVDDIAIFLPHLCPTFILSFSNVPSAMIVVSI